MKTNNIYRGRNSEGKVKITIDGKCVLGTGVMYRGDPAKSADGNSYTKWTKIRNQKNCEVNSDTPTIYCVGVKSKKRYRFKGKVQNEQEIIGPAKKISRTEKFVKGQVDQKNENQNGSSCGEKNERASNMVSETETKKESKRSQPNPCKQPIENFDNEIARLISLHARGLNPQIKMHLVCLLADESRANLYRKIKCGTFPPPLKRGRSAFWKYSEVDAYLNGEWKSAEIDANPPNRKAGKK